MKDIFDFSGFSIEQILSENTKTKSVCSDEMPLAIAFVAMQEYKKTYEPDSALTFGTLFPELNKPFCRGKGEWGVSK